MSTELARCPFCWSRPKLEDHRTRWAVVCVCSACVLGAQAPEPTGDESSSYWQAIRDSAIAAWNRRAATPAQPVEGWTDLNASMPEPEVFVMTWDGRKVAVDWWGSLRHRGDGVTHWMPFPAPPNAGPMYGTHSIAAPQAAPTEESIGSVIRAGVGEK